MANAGGPYESVVDEQDQLTGDVVGASAVRWTIDSGPGLGTFSNANVLSPFFTPHAVGTYILRLAALLVTGCDSDTAVFESTPGAPDPEVDNVFLETVRYQEQ